MKYSMQPLIYNIFQIEDLNDMMNKKLNLNLGFAQICVLIAHY